MYHLRRALEIYRDDGVASLVGETIRYVTPSWVIEFYRTEVWPQLPETADHGTYNGVRVRGRHPMFVDAPEPVTHRVLDGVVPWHTPSRISNFKGTGTDRIHERCGRGDTVVIVGGGNGVSAVHSARAVGGDGRVVVFEADADRVADIRETLSYNGVDDVCEVRHAIVGRAHRVENAGGAAVVAPAALPQCDVLELDCEGAELEILTALDRGPGTVIVELHHEKPYAPYESPDAIRSRLEEMGYCIETYRGPWVDGLFLATRDEATDGAT